MPPTMERLRQAGLKATGPRVMCCLRLSKTVVTLRRSNSTNPCRRIIHRCPCRQCTRRSIPLSARGCVGGYPTLAIVFGWMAPLRITITRCAGLVAPFSISTERFFHARCHRQTCQTGSRLPGCASSTMSFVPRVRRGHRYRCPQARLTLAKRPRAAVQTAGAKHCLK